MSLDEFDVFSENFNLYTELIIGSITGGEALGQLGSEKKKMPENRFVRKRAPHPRDMALCSSLVEIFRFAARREKELRPYANETPSNRRRIKNTF